MAATEELLGLLHEAVTDDLLRRFKEAKENPLDPEKQLTPQEIAQAIKFLKDNGIEALPEASNKLNNLAKEMPDFSGEEPLYAN